MICVNNTYCFSTKYYISLEVGTQQKSYIIYIGIFIRNLNVLFSPDYSVDAWYFIHTSHLVVVEWFFNFQVRNNGLFSIVDKEVISIPRKEKGEA